MHNIHTEEECWMLVCLVQTHCVKLWLNIFAHYCLFADKINTWQVGKFTKKALINKHLVKAAYFKLMCLWRCSQNRWRHCKIVLFWLKALDLWCSWTIQQCASKFFWGRVKMYSYKEIGMAAILVVASPSTENQLCWAF